MLPSDFCLTVGITLRSSQACFQHLPFETLSFHSQPNFSEHVKHAVSTVHWISLPVKRDSIPHSAHHWQTSYAWLNSQEPFYTSHNLTSQHTTPLYSFTEHFIITCQKCELRAILMSNVILSGQNKTFVCDDWQFQEMEKDVLHSEAKTSPLSLVSLLLSVSVKWPEENYRAIFNSCVTCSCPLSVITLAVTGAVSTRLEQQGMLGM